MEWVQEVLAAAPALAPVVMGFVYVEQRRMNDRLGRLLDRLEFVVEHVPLGVYPTGTGAPR